MSDKGTNSILYNALTVSVDTENLRTYSKQLKGIYDNADRLGNRVLNLAKNFDAVNAARCLTDSATVLKKCKDYLDYTASAFEDTENYLSKIKPTDVNAIRFGVITASISDDPSARAVSGMALKAKSITQPGKSISLTSEKKLVGYFKGKSLGYAFADDGNGQTWSSTKKWGDYRKGQEAGDAIDRLLVQSGEKKERKLPISLDIELLGATHQFFDKSKIHLGEDSPYWDVKVANAEAHASYSGGYSTEKGWYIEGEIGGSVSLLASSVTGSLGSDKLGIHGNVNAEVGTVSGSLAGGWSQKEGFHASAGLEADLVKVGLTGGVTVLGVDADVTANVKVGVGFHAKVGYKKGVVTCDLGAALGLGFDVKLKVDVKKPVKAVKKAAKAAWRKVKSWF